MAPAPSRADAEREHQIFWLLVKGSRDHPVGRVYLAIQAALAYGHARLDAGWLMGAMMARGRKTSGPHGEEIGGSGLAYFYWLYEVELAAAGPGETHEYRFRRRGDGKEILVYLKTGSEPRGLHFQQDYEREKRKLEKQREKFLAGYRWQVAENSVDDAGDGLI